MASSTWMTLTWNHYVLWSQESLIFHDDSCVESMSNLMGIILVLILVLNYLLSKATTKETRCIILSFIPQTLKGGCRLWSKCDTILKPENLQLQALLVTFEDKTLLYCIHEDLINGSLAIAIRSHWKNPPNDFDKFKFRDGLLCHDGLLYVLKDLMQL
jgi:hypothetical protein